MKLKISTFLFLLCALITIYAQQTSGFRFQGSIINKDFFNNPIMIKIQALNEMDLCLYEEQHEVVCGESGVFNLIFGQGVLSIGSFDLIDWSKDITVQVFGKTDENSSWIDFGRSKVLKIPYSKYAQKTMTIVNNDNLEQKSIAYGSKTILSDNNTIIDLSENACIGLLRDYQILNQKQYKIDAVLKENKSLYFSSDNPNGNKEGLISFHWTILSSKPAVVGYDESFRRRFAVVAHYWSNSGRPHQHISFEVDTKSTGTIETRFAFPWGDPRCFIQVFGNFSINNKGGIIVGNEKDSSNIYFYGNTFFFSGFCLGDKLIDDLYSSFKVYSPNKSAYVSITQLQGNYPARLKLTQGAKSWSLSLYANELRFLSEDNVSLTIQGVGNAEDKKYEIKTTGTIASSNISTSSSWIAQYMISDNDIPLGNIVGLNPSDGKIRSYEAGDIIIGVVVDSLGIVLNYDSKSTVNREVISTLGEVEMNKSQYKVLNGIAYTLDDKKIGVMLSNNKTYIKF